MKLLIITQTVDIEDPVLGFFVRWIEEFAKRTEHIEVICLKEGKHELPANVRVHSLGKERSSAERTIFSRVAYAGRFLSLIWKLRNEYDTIFVHMNPEYVVLGGLFWRLWGKRCALWYTHKSVDTKLRLAALLASIIFTASKESFRLPTQKLYIMGHGIDTEFFSPDSSVVRTDWILSVGRLTKSKRHDLIIRAAARANRDLRIVGDGPERKNLEVLASALGARVHFLGGLSQPLLRDEYRRAVVFVHTSETGSLDKTVLEALATDTPVITTSGAYQEFPVLASEATPEAIAEALGRPQKADNRPEIIREKHSLQHLIPALVEALQTPRILFLFPTSRENIMSKVQKGEDADTALRGLNHIRGAQYATVGDYPGNTIFSQLPKALQAFLLLPRLLTYDFIIAQDDLLLGYVISVCARTFRLRTRWMYLAMNSSVVMRRHAAHPIRRIFLTLFWKSYFRIICLSFEQIDDFVRLGISRERLAFVPLGVDVPFFAHPGSENEGAYVASVGRDAGRDYETLFRAAERVSRPFSVIAGRSNIPSDMFIPANVSVCYDRSYLEVRDLYAHARFVVVASKDARARDGSDCSGQTVVLDALAAGKAVIATRLPWITDYLVPGEDLIVVEPNDPMALAQAIEILWQDDERRMRLAASGRAKVIKHYATDQFAASLLRLMATTT